MLTPSSWNIRRRLVMIITSLTLLLVLAVAAIALNANAASLRAQTEQTYISINQTLANALDTDLQTAVTTARTFAAALANEPVSSPVSQLWQMSSNILLDETNLVRRINVYAPFREGHQTLVFNTPIEPARTAALTQFIDGDVPADAWFLKVIEEGEAIWHGPDDPFDPSATQPAISYAVPYTGPSGDMIGVVWVDIPYSTLHQHIQTITDADDKRSYSLLLTADNLLASTYKLPVELTERNQAIVDKFLSQEKLTDTRADVDATGQLMLGTDPLNNQRGAAVLVNQLPKTGWQIVSLVPSTVLQNQLDRTILGVLSITFIGVAILGWVVYLFVDRTVSKPLRALGTAAQEIGSGDLRYHIEYQSQRDEIGWLAKAMEAMKVNLAHSYRQLSIWSQTLEKRVEQRTAELELTRKVAQESASELQSVYDAAMAVVNDYQLDTLLQKLMQNMLELLETGYCAVWLITDDKEHLQMVATTSTDKTRLNMTIGVDEGLVGAVLQQAKLLVVQDYAHWPNRLESLSDPLVEQAMSTPLLFYKKPIGAVLVGRTKESKAFSERDQRLLTLFANLVTPVIRNAQLFIQREEAQMEAERASGVKTRFLASVTHELRTPLNLIINNMDFMRIGQFGDVTPEQRDRLDQTIRSAEHLLYLINDLLDVSKIEAGEMELTVVPADLKPILEDALDSALMMLERKTNPIVIEAHIPPDLPLIPMDARRVRQVLTNLLSNAVKFTQEGRIDLIISLHPDMPANASVVALLENKISEGGSIEFEVRDTGMGIPKEEMNKLFEAFERTDRAKYMGIEGTGLGLPISRFLVEAHGGKMIVESTVGKGSSFRFTLPLKAIPQDKPISMNLGRVVMTPPPGTLKVSDVPDDAKKIYKEE
jgi:signal transduction histidine kinase/HAMP domain-containing protein